MSFLLLRERAIAPMLTDSLHTHKYTDSGRVSKRLYAHTRGRTTGQNITSFGEMYYYYECAKKNSGRR